MAYVQSEQSLWLAAQVPAHEIRLGDTERQVILRARRDLLAGRPGKRLGNPRLEALRLYAMLGRYRPDAARPLLAAGFSPAERRVVDAMLDALPTRTHVRPATGRMIWALLILLPLLAASGTYGWASFYLQDRLIAAILAGLALLLFMPVAHALASHRRPTATGDR
jgi:hypothetical protein